MIAKSITVANDKAPLRVYAKVYPSGYWYTVEFWSGTRLLEGQSYVITGTFTERTHQIAVLFDAFANAHEDERNQQVKLISIVFLDEPRLAASMN